MNLNVDLGSVHWKNLRPGRKILASFILLLLVAAAACGYWHHITHPPKPWLVRWRLDRYLAKHGGSGNFKVAFQLPSKSEMARASAAENGDPKGSQTGKTYDALRDEYFDVKTAVIRLQTASATNDARAAELQVKEKALAPIVADLWEFNRRFAGIPENATVPLAKARADLIRDTDRKLGEAQSYAAMYTLIGQELWVADRLLESRDIAHRREGILLALAAGRQAVDQAVDGWVAARIAEGYLLPNLDVADQSPRSPLAFDNLVRQCAGGFRINDEFQNMARVYESILAKSPNPQRADWARYQLADAYQQGGDPKMALAYLKKVQNTNDNRLSRRIAFLQRQVGP